MTHQRQAVQSGLWTLMRYDPRRRERGERPLVLDSGPPTMKVRDHAATEARYKMLSRMAPAEAERLMTLAQEDVDRRRRLYELLASGGLAPREA
jgi:pyruvate-ferredoxin/flavodoxin oxidoreductase